MITEPAGRLAVIDLETTGLDPDTGLILEVGVVVVDSRFDEVADHAVLLADPAALDWAVGTTRRAAEGAELDIPERMHLDSGLIADLTGFANAEGPGRPDVAFTTADAEAAIGAFLTEQGITEPVPLTGSSVRSLDGPFLQRHMPNLFSRFTHRTIDASALTEFARFVDPDGHAAIMDGVPAAGHRTIEDCRRSIEIIRRFARRYGVGAVAAAAV